MTAYLIRNLRLYVSLNPPVSFYFISVCFFFSMDECEALCNRLTIMVKGQLVCIGNIQYLKQRFGQGFTLMVKLHAVKRSDSVLAQLKTDIENTFAPECLLKDEHEVGCIFFNFLFFRISSEYSYSD